MPITKSPGSSLGCHISFLHRGDGLRVWAGFALAEHPYPPVWGFSAFNSIDVPPHGDWTAVATSPEGTIPSDCPAAIYDSRVVLASAAPSGALPPEGSWILKKWDYNVVEVIGGPAPPPEGEAEFKDLTTGPYGNRVGVTVPTITPGVVPPTPPPTPPPVPPPTPPPVPGKLVISNERLVPWAKGATLSFNSSKVARMRFRHRETGLTELGNPHQWLWGGVWVNNEYVGDIRGTAFKGNIMARRYFRTQFEMDRSIYGNREIQPEAYDVETGDIVYGKILGPFEFPY